MLTPPGYPPLLLRLRTRQLALLSLLDAERNLGRAATALNISQPAASKLLQQAEDTFGVPLFERHARGMAPTPYGEVIVRYARRMLTDFDYMHQEIIALHSGLQGALRIGTVPGAIPQLLAPMLVDYKQQHPHVAVSILVDTSNMMIRQLARGEVDLVLGRLTAGHGEGDYSSAPLLNEALVVVARASHPLVQHDTVSFDELISMEWILQPAGAPQRVRFEAALHEAGVDMHLNITETASTIATTAMLEISDMVAVMPASLAEHYGRLGVIRVLPVDLPIHLQPIHLITRRNQTLSPAATQFVAAMRNHARNVDEAHK
ncbi:LysR family transcriptional regulator [Pollutimonas nitritireducens]|uniref:LysR family transcriptional regulator n=1 Tax=Pollutimonas nitritireducens TaxID=2045209 RepID=A0A2N4ULB6_9BURK|nr:LysR family transcriptional regulator [Pollutimonas nitritireducens]PLC55819.1 LysR family transcriptional regulator [Pollutimonas nitritireducens]